MKYLYQALAARQHGCISRSQIQSFLTRHQVARLLKQGALSRGSGSVYLVVGSPDTFERAVWLATLSVPDGAICGESAARFWGFALPGDDAEPIHVVTSARHHEFALKGKVHRSIQVEGFVEEVGGLRVTSVARTLIDLTAWRSPREIAAYLDKALAKRLVTLEEIETTLNRMRTQGRHRVRVIRRALSRRNGADAGVTNWSERRVLRALRNGGLPDPVPQFEVLVERWRYFIDFAYPRGRIAIEVDEAHHDGPDQRKSDHHREADLWRSGWEVIRVHRNDEPFEYLNRIRNALQRAEARREHRPYQRQGSESG